MKISEKWQFYDVCNFESDTLESIPSKVAAVFFAFPENIDKKAMEFGEKEDKADVYFIQQDGKNACGTVAMLHAIENNRSQIEFKGGLTFK